MDKIFKELGEICRKARNKDDAARHLLEAVGEMLQKENWDFNKIPEHNLIKTGISTKMTYLGIFIRTYGPGNSLSIHTLCPVNVPQGKRDNILEFINSCNYCMRTGNFEMDRDDGEVRFRTSIFQGKEPITADVMQYHLHLGIKMMDDAYPVLMGIVFGGLTPAEGVKKFQES